MKKEEDTMRRISLMAIAAGLYACGQPGTPVPVVGSPVDLTHLAGRWVGDFSSVETGRSGSIVFRLSASGDSAFGDVLMNPTAIANRSQVRDPSAAPTMPPAPTPQWIEINFVRVAGGRISGTLKPYTDPTCNCPLFTMFEGRLAGDTLSGTYTSRHQAGGPSQQGRWTAVRERS